MSHFYYINFKTVLIVTGTLYMLSCYLVFVVLPLVIYTKKEKKPNLL